MDTSCQQLSTQQHSTQCLIRAIATLMDGTKTYGFNCSNKLLTLLSFIPTVCTV